LETSAETDLLKFGIGIKFSSSSRKTFVVVANASGDNRHSSLAMLVLPPVHEKSLPVEVREVHVGRAGLLVNI
jgi:hypothetical protein